MASTPPNEAISIEERNKLAVEYLPVVRRIARGMSHKAPPQVSFDDLVGAGLLGLMDAASRYDPSKKERFGAFVSTRIRGSMLDELRNADPLSRDLRAKSNRLAKTIRDVNQHLGRQATEQEIADAMGVSIDAYRDLLLQLQQASFLAPVNVEQALETYRDLAPADGDPHSNLLFEEMRSRLAEAISKLSEKEQRVLSWYYKDELSLQEIGDRLGVTDSRVCQIRTQAVHRLRALLTQEERDG